ncbi:HAMP domain-containing sensor histidine kinase [Streptomyces scopuliridis]|uniref:HAMP domain-containing sensor histidine kinase n=1 Tax=Streptomyces scopuliridis TaxID=452529 RepID=UPI0035D9D624
MPVVVYLDTEGRPTGQLELGPHSTTGLHLPDLNPAAVAEHGTQAFTMSGANDAPRWRVVVMPLSVTAATAARTAGYGATSVVVATSLSKVDATADRLWTISTSVAAALLTLLTVLGWFAVRSGLRPLTRIEETATVIASGGWAEVALPHRVPELDAPHTEVGRLASAINGMLAQIDTALAARATSETRMRRFVADASHELRTPLAGIKGFTDLYQMGLLPTSSDVERTMSRIAGESARLTKLVEDMLTLARLDEATAAAGTPHSNPATPLQLAPTDLRTLAVDALHDVRALDPTRSVTLTGPDGGTPASAVTFADEAALRQVVTNLVGNAITHTPAGSPILIGVGISNGYALLEVADHGPGLTQEQAGRVFERFYRADSSRTRATGAGAGLGLSIVQSLIDAHHGRVELTTAPGAGANFRILLPPAIDRSTTPARPWRDET